MEKLLALQQRRHDELTNALARTAQQRDDVIAKLVRIEAKLTDLKRKVGRSGRRLADTREALQEVAATPPPAPVKPAKEKPKRLAPEGDPIAEVISAASLADKAAKLRESIRSERLRKRN